MLKFGNIVKVMIGLALVVALSLSSFTQPSLAVTSTDSVSYDSDYVSPAWWAEAGAASLAGAAGGAAGGAVAGAAGSPAGMGAGAATGAAAGAVAGFVGYAVTSLFASSAQPMDQPVSDALFDY